MKSVIVDFFSFVLLEKKHHKATFPIKISVQKITILEISTLLSFEWANPESGKIQNTNTSILNFTAFIFFKQDKNILSVLAYLMCIRSFLLRKKMNLYFFFTQPLLQILSYKIFTKYFEVLVKGVVALQQKTINKIRNRKHFFSAQTLNVALHSYFNYVKMITLQQVGTYTIMFQIFYINP